MPLPHGLHALADREPQSAGEEADQSHVAGQAVFLLPSGVDGQAHEGQQQAAPLLGPGNHVELVRLPVPVVGEVDRRQHPFRRFERSIEQSDADQHQHDHARQDRQHLERSVPFAPEPDAEKRARQADPDPALDEQTQHSPPVRRVSHVQIRDDFMVMGQADRLAVRHRASEAEGHRGQGHRPCDLQRRGVRAEQKHQCQGDEHAGHHCPGLVTVLAANAPAHAARRGRGEQHQPQRRLLRGRGGTTDGRIRPCVEVRVCHPGFSDGFGSKSAVGMIRADEREVKTRLKHVLCLCSGCGPGRSCGAGGECIAFTRTAFTSRRITDRP